ncbi:DUF4388 domain-containing protein [Oscillochloris sp. ZM17-4]|uniref:DUF4388 domain-containing protein n=1 Tax=Oscillochloris sp. ZM17-4 TaxID=2866714 RepID=UPI001C732F98|nr:DUF4388 domain-containing protein [Oscillochloris sp. ZM17-4]MBX0329217.1 DUF4388 domain-containing protein [Oscillochloris sp. ZM17-4]
MILQGSFALMSPAALIQTLCQEQRTVTIRASRAGSKAEVWVMDGIIVGARCDEHTDEEAIYRMAQWPDGVFTVSAGAANAPETMAADAETLLLEAARQRDEGDLPAPTPQAAATGLDRILSACPALKGGTLVRTDGATISMGMPETSPLVAASLSSVGAALDAPPGIVAYIGHGHRLLLTRSGAGHMLLASVRQGESLGEAGAQIERAFSASV